MYRFVFCLALLFAANDAVTQDERASIQRLSAEQFIERVAKANPRVAVADADVDAAAARVSAAGLWENPTIAYDREEVFENGHGAPENTVRLELPIDVSGRRALLISSARQGVEAARADASVNRIVILTEAMRIYLKAAAWREHLDILVRTREALAGMRDSISSRASAGDASGYDLARIEIELSSLDDLIAGTERELVKSRLRIGLMIGQPGVQYDTGETLTTEGLSEPTEAEGLLFGKPRVAAAQHRVTKHDLGRKAAARGWVPSLILTGGAKTAASNGDTVWGYVAGIALTIPILDRGQADKEQAEAELRRARAKLAVIEQQTLSNIAVARESYERSVHQAKRFERDQLPRLEQLLRRAEVSYREGERPVFELLDAYRTARDVRVRYVRLKLQARLSHIELVEALGWELGEN